MRLSLILSIIFFTASAALAVNISGEYPICTSERAIGDFEEAKMFSDHDKMIALIEDGSCIMVEPDIKGTIIENTFHPKILVFIPYHLPITGWTTADNLK